MRKAILASLFVSYSAFAGEHGEMEKNHPCKKIRDACEAAGFKKGGHKDKKGLYKDCMEPVLSGQTVAGVTVAAADVAACKAKKAEHHK